MIAKQSNAELLTGHNAHMYYLLQDPDDRTRFMDHVKQEGVNCVFPCVPLHPAPYGVDMARPHEELMVAPDQADRLARLPLWLGLEQKQACVIEQVIDAVGVVS